MENEGIFIYLLLMHGGDPEPDKSKSSATYAAWRDEVIDTLEEQGLTDECFSSYWRWLRDHGLHNLGVE